MCRFGIFSVLADIVTESKIVCRAMPKSQQVVSVGISFDGIHWSAERFLFVYKARENFLKVAALTGAWLITVVGIALVIWWRVGGSPVAVTPGEAEPFIVRGPSAGAGVVRKRKMSPTRKRIEA
jgi:hypothetical protein